MAWALLVKGQVPGSSDHSPGAHLADITESKGWSKTRPKVEFLGSRAHVPQRRKYRKGLSWKKIPTEMDFSLGRQVVHWGEGSPLEHSCLTWGAGSGTPTFCPAGPGGTFFFKKKNSIIEI